MANDLAIIEQNFQAVAPVMTELLPPLPDVDAQRIIHGAVQAIKASGQNSFLQKAVFQNPQHAVNAILTAANLGLTLDGYTGQAFLVPFNDKRIGPFPQFMPGYKGYITLSDRGGWTLRGELVRERDEFEYEPSDIARPLHHKFAGIGERQRGDIIGAYALATHPNRHPRALVLGLDEINRSRDASASYRADKKNGTRKAIWNINYGVMAKKTPLRLLGSQMPLNTLAQMAEIERRADEEGRGVWIGDDREVHETPAALEGPQQVDHDPTEREQETYSWKSISTGEVNAWTDPDRWQAQCVNAVEKAPADKLEEIREANRDFIEAARTKAPKQAQAIEIALDRRIAERDGGMG